MERGLTRRQHFTQKITVITSDCRRTSATSRRVCSMYFSSPRVGQFCTAPGAIRIPVRRSFHTCSAHAPVGQCIRGSRFLLGISLPRHETPTPTHTHGADPSSTPPTSRLAAVPRVVLRPRSREALLPRPLQVRWRHGWQVHLVRARRRGFEHDARGWGRTCRLAAAAAGATATTSLCFGHPRRLDGMSRPARPYSAVQRSPKGPRLPGASSGSWSRLRLFHSSEPPPDGPGEGG